MLTTAEAAALLVERGITVRGKPPMARTVEAWCRSGVLKARRVGGPRRGVWLIEKENLIDFAPPKLGHPKKPTD